MIYGNPFLAAMNEAEDEATQLRAERDKYLYALVAIRNRTLLWQRDKAPEVLREVGMIAKLALPHIE